MLIETARYELPPEGITLLGYIVRRMHKTEWLVIARSLLIKNKPAEALESEADPITGAMVTARLESISPHYHISYEVTLPNGDTFKGSESITGTTVGLRGLGMPAPSKFTFKSGDYVAEFEGILTSELALSLLGNTRIRAYGSMSLKDNRGNKGQLKLNRTGDITININGQPTMNHSITRITWMNAQLPSPQSA